MAEVIIMPKLGFNMNEGKLVKWYKQEGDSIKKGDNFFSIETDKTNMDIEATSDGIVRKLLIEEGEQIPVTLPIAVIAGKEEEIAEVINRAMADLGKETSEETQNFNLPSIEDETDTADNDYDVIVIGGGPGGYVAAIKAAQMGKRTAIIEKDSFGGTCLNAGCIPTKALLRSAEAFNEVKESVRFGITGVEILKARLDFGKIQERKEQVVRQLVGGIQGLLKGNGVTIIKGEGRLIEKNIIEVEGRKYSTEHVIIATGSASKELSIPINPKMEVLTSKEMLDIQEAPKTMVIIGGGVIGVEFAYFLASTGTQVTIIEFLDRILPMVDEEITAQVSARLE
ncbi:FAD-dependent oxidoreductase, partial [Aminipila sp.]|uniref:FAD-dependent oxidoreductase n=1 Tax=Aminipila sp. TaxID=2060095 RepID=UPI00289E90DF